jgi:protein-disulfide isomerase
MNAEKFAIPLAVVFAGVLIAGAFYFSNAKQTNDAKKNPATNQAATQNIRPIDASDHILGNPNAQLILVEYSDTECPYCKAFQTTLKQMMTDYGPSGQVAWVYRHFPLHSKSEKEAEATECAGELGGPDKFWDYLNMIYDNTPSNDGLDPAQLPIFAKNVGLDVDAFNTCLASGKYADKVQADYNDAIASGGQGTPHSVLVSRDGAQTPIDGALPYAQLKTEIDSLLKN